MSGRQVAGYGTDVDPDVIRAWWSLRSLRAARWLIEHGFDPWPLGEACGFAESRMLIDVNSHCDGYARLSVARVHATPRPSSPAMSAAIAGSGWAAW